MKKLILCSQSPRRSWLLKQAGFQFDTFAVNISEYLEKNLSVQDQIRRISERKLDEAVRLYNPLKSGEYFLLSADTMVILDDQAIGKPQTFDEACTILRQLSGKNHGVLTAVSLQKILFDGNEKKIKFDKPITLHDTTMVEFYYIPEEQILSYVATGEPMDKAGAYGIQGIGSKFVKQIYGQYDNVMGLPLDEVKKLLRVSGFYNIT